MDPAHSLLEEGRASAERRSWKRAYEALDAARQECALEPDDLWKLALAAFLIGREEDFVRSLQEVHQIYRERGDAQAAARAAIWLGIHGDSQGDVAQATGWFGRAERLLDRGPPECAERGYLLVPAARKRLMTGDFEGGRALAAEAAGLAQRFDDGELLALAVHIEGRALLAAGRVAEGLACLDEAMIGVTADELSPQVTGLVYCSVLSACREVWALDRMREWTSMLTDWCASQPDMVAYTGECRVYHAEVLLRSGRWDEALTGARDAITRFAAGSQPSATGFACYVEGEVHRLKGEFAASEEAYRAATAAGYTPQPGFALLRLAQGDLESASAAIRRALAETPIPLRRARLLSAAAEIWLEEGDTERAGRACDELAEAARTCAAEVIGTHLAQQRGAVALAGGRPEEALAHLRPAWREWQALGAPWDAARTRVLLALACRALGDAEGAAMELDAARADFDRLGAAADVARIDAMSGRRGSRGAHGLTPREREVLALVATGKTNRAVARALSISDKTVARHVANIFAKLGLSSRAAATAYAYEHDLLDA